MLRALPVLLLLATPFVHAQATAPAPARAAPPAVPQVIVSYPPAVLVRIDGPPSMAPIPGRAKVERVQNTKALILLADKPNTEAVGDRQRHLAYYLRVRDGWMTAAWLAGPWRPADVVPFLLRQLDAIAADLERQGEGRPVDVDLASARASGRVPTVFVTETPAELVLFSGTPRYEPVGDTRLARAVNADRVLVRDEASRALYLQTGAGWLVAPALDGPWRLPSPAELPGDLARIR